MDAEGRQPAAFGYCAGYLGAALAVLHTSGTLTLPLTGFDRDEFDAALAHVAGAAAPATLVTGALGRSGRGVRHALAVTGVVPTGWDMDETRDLDKGALLRMTCSSTPVLASGQTQPSVDKDDVADPLWALAAPLLRGLIRVRRGGTAAVDDRAVFTRSCSY